MKKSILTLIFCAFAAFALTSCDQANAKPIKKDYGNCIARAVEHQSVFATAYIQPSFGVLLEKVYVPKTVFGYVVITTTGSIRQKTGYPGYNYLQCRKS